MKAIQISITRYPPSGCSLNLYGGLIEFKILLEKKPLLKFKLEIAAQLSDPKNLRQHISIPEPFLILRTEKSFTSIPLL
jgi:hypothetical protein